MATKVYKVANSLGLKLYFHWKSGEDPTMVLVDKGSSGPWLDFDNLSLDCEAIAKVESQQLN